MTDNKEKIIELLIVLLSLTIAIAFLTLLLMKKRFEEKSSANRNKTQIIESSANSRINKITRELEILKNSRKMLLQQLDDLKKFLELKSNIAIDNIHIEFNHEAEIARIENMAHETRNESNKLIKQLNEEISILETHNKKLTLKVNQLNSQIDRNHSQNKIQDQECEINQLKDAVNLEQAVSLEFRRINEELVALLRKTNEVLQQTQIKNMEFQETKAEFEIQLNLSNKNCLEREETIKTLRSELRDEKNDNIRHQREVCDKDSELRKAREEIDALKQQNDSLKSVHDILSSEQENLVKKNLILQLELSALRQQPRSLKNPKEHNASKISEEDLLDDRKEIDLTNSILITELEEHKSSTLNKLKVLLKTL